VEKLLAYQFKDKSLLDIALTHRSYSRQNNERLEYLGDSVLGFVVAETLYRKFPGQTEGVLTRLRATLVNKGALADIARTLELGEFIKLGTGEMKSGGWKRDSILANAVEALIGAIYLDSDLPTCRDFILELYRDMLSGLTLSRLEKDPKTELQEYLQARKQPLPGYIVIAEDGAAHNRKFTVACRLDGLDQEISASGKSKRIAEQSAARKVLEYLQGGRHSGDV
jgi:ribonuclease-3